MENEPNDQEKVDLTFAQWSSIAIVIHVGWYLLYYFVL